MEGFTLLCLVAFTPTMSADYWYGRELDKRVTLKVIKRDAFRDALNNHRGKPIIVYVSGKLQHYRPADVSPYCRS